jgi:hypothetical protein
MLLACNKPQGKKPLPKWLVRLMKQRFIGNGSLSFTFSKKKEIISCQRWFFVSVSLFGETKTFLSSKFGDIIQANFVFAKPFVKLLECCRILDAGNRVSWLLHGHTLYFVAS